MNLEFNMNVIIGFCIGIIAYVVLYIGKGIQKFAIEGLKVDKKIKSKHSWIWIFGTILTTVYMFIQWAALFFAPINIIAPLEGVGLIVLLIFSYYVLKERISVLEILGVIIIIIGIILITLFNINPPDAVITNFNLSSFILFLSVILGIEGVLILISKFNKYKLAGLIIGTTAGSFMAFQTVAKRITSIPDPNLTLIFIIITLITALLTLLITQFAFTKAKANQVLPCFTSASIILAAVVGFFSLNELIIPVQIIGIGCVVAGVILLTAFKKEEPLTEETKSDKDTS